MRYYYDTEFLELGPAYPIHLLSIGVVCDDGRELYLQNLNCPLQLASRWVVDNVFPGLVELTALVGEHSTMYHPNGNAPVWQYREAIAVQLIDFMGKYPEIETWAYYGAYDHVALCQLFGRMIDLPKGFPMYTRDLKQWCDQLGNPRLPEQGKGEHNALSDARWNKRVYDFLQGREFFQASS